MNNRVYEKIAIARNGGETEKFTEVNKMTMATCVYCGIEKSTDFMIRVPMSNRGKKHAYICSHCASSHAVESYSTENNKRRGMNIGGGFTYSVEFETATDTPELRAELTSVGFIPSHDCTVACEYKSPIYNNLKPLAKKLQTVEKLCNHGYASVDETCGTHFHVGHESAISPYTMMIIEGYYHELFTPLSDYLLSHADDTRRVFGRELGTYNYATPINGGTWEQGHSNFINIQHDYTLEFRLCRFRTAGQYMHVAKLCKDITACIITNFLAYNDADAETREHKANVTAGKLVRLFKKYAANAPEW